MPQMNPEIKADWIANLRSGKFEQGREYLNINGKMCCLGVLCEMAHWAGIVPKNEYKNGAGVGVTTYGEEGNAYVLPREVREWIGFTPRLETAQEDLMVMVPELATQQRAGDRGFNLTYLNDGKEWTFEQIATALEEDDEL